MKKRVFMWSTIYERLLFQGVKGYEIDIRYLGRWISLYPTSFPKFMRLDKFQAYFNWELTRWEITKTA